MCGISGIIYSDTPNWSRLENMRNHQHMRGQDNKGTWIHGNVGLAHNRLSIIDTSASGNQPMHTERWALVYNGEIYNYQELRAKIGPRQWKSYGDTETLLFYIDQYGIEKTLQDIEGMFAFAAYDKFEKKLYMATDPFGIKPLYYTSDLLRGTISGGYWGGLFAFASSPAALTHTRERKWAINRKSLESLLALGATREPLFDGIKKCAAGHLYIYDQRGLKYFRYYQLKQHKISEDDLIDITKESIRKSRISDVPVYLFLSGGIDSTIVASQCDGYNAIHLASPEAEYAKKVASRYRNTLIFINPKNYSAKDCLEDYARQSGDCAGASIIPYMTAKEVSKYGKVAISANGADELFCGYNRITQSSPKQIAHIFRRHFLAPRLNSTNDWRNYYKVDDSRIAELNTYVQFDLNKTLDFASMCHGLEVRVPYLNKTVVEAALSLPISAHVNGLGNKSILKRFLIKEGFTKQFVNRPKLGFSLFYEPEGYQELKDKGIEVLNNEFNVNPNFQKGSRDHRYYEASAAAFYCWLNVWKDKIYGIA